MKKSNNKFHGEGLQQVPWRRPTVSLIKKSNDEPHREGQRQFSQRRPTASLMEKSKGPLPPLRWMERNILREIIQCAFVLWSIVSFVEIGTAAPVYAAQCFVRIFQCHAGGWSAVFCGNRLLSHAYTVLHSLQLQ